MKSYLKLSLLMLFFITSCDSDDFSEDNNNVLTIEVGPNALLNEEGSSNYFVVHGSDGSVFSSGELTNGENLNIELADANEESVSVSLIRKIEFSGFVTTTINSFLEVGVNETLKIIDLANEFPSSDSQAEISLENINEGIESIRFSRPGFFSIADPTFFQSVPSYSYRFAQNRPEIFITSQLAERAFKYTSVTLSPDESITIDPNNGITMEESAISTGDQSLIFSAGLSGINNNDSGLDHYSLYSAFELENNNGTINIPLPLSNTFDVLDVFVRGVDDNIVYDQRTKGSAAPISFTQLSVDITINNTDFENIDFTVAGEHNIVYSAWENEDRSLVWRIYSPDGQTDGFQIPDLSDDEIFNQVLQEVDNLDLTFVTAGQLDDLSYTDLLNESSIVRSHRFALNNESINTVLAKSVVNQ